jgi:hypothetical protein
MAKQSKRRAASARKSATKPEAAAIAVPRILNCVPSIDADHDWRIEHAVAAGLVAAVPIPAAKDLREAWWKIGDQGATGSCVGWATADSVLRWHFVKAGKIQKSEQLSPRFIWMAAKETDEFVTQPTTFVESEGTSLKAALDIGRKYGALKDSVLPFASGALFQGKAQALYAIAAQLKIASYINLGRDPATWRQWLATNGPILTRLNCDTAWMQAKQTGGVLTTYDPMSNLGGHAVALVGYDQTRFIVRNSWGTTLWGDAGFGYASNAYAGAAFTEAYGVTVS